MHLKLPIWHELLAGVEIAYLRVSPVCWGYGIPRGDGSAVVVIPGFLMTDFYLGEFRS
jgi:triacylglycerol lipase